MIAHPFDVLVMSLNTIVELLHKFLMLVAIVNRSGTQIEYMMTASLNSTDFFNYAVRQVCTLAVIPENEAYAISISRFYLIK